MEYPAPPGLDARDALAAQRRVAPEFNAHERARWLRDHDRETGAVAGIC
jgi:hypothetical protein